MKREKIRSASVVFSQSVEQSPGIEEAILTDSQRALDFIVQEDYISALEITEKSISFHGKECGFLPHFLQDSFSRSDGLLPGSLLLIHCYASSLFKLGELLNVQAYYKRAEDKAREGLSLGDSQEILNHQTIPTGTIQLLKEDLEFLIKLVEEKRKADFDFNEGVAENEPNYGLTAEVENRAEILSLWTIMGDERKQDLLRVDIEKFKRYVEGNYSSQRGEALEKALTFAKANRKWVFWRCGACSMEFHSFAECREHLEYEHLENFTPPEDLVPRIVNEDCSKMIHSVNWEPRNTVMKNYEDSALATGNRANLRNILKEFGKLLKSISKRKMLSSSLWDWLKQQTVRCLKESGISEDYISYTGLDKSPSCFCFLELDPLKTMLAFLRFSTISIRTDKVSRAVDGIREKSRVTLSISSDKEFSCLLLNNDDKVSPQGDEIISWILDRTQTDEDFVFKRPVMVHNLDIWLAVLRNLEWESKAQKRKYQRKLNLRFYSKGLEEVQRSLDRWRAHPQGWVEETYQSLLLKACRNRLKNGSARSSVDAIRYLSVVRDVVKEARSPTFKVIEVEEYLNHISDAYVNDDSVLQSFSVLKQKISNKVHFIDSAILLHENAKRQLLDDLTNLSMFDYRLVILPLLKPFLREELEKMIETDSRKKGRYSRS